jgi:hypothetical protein
MRRRLVVRRALTSWRGWLLVMTGGVFAVVGGCPTATIQRILVALAVE